MSWPTVLWSIAAGASLTLCGLHLLLAFRERSRPRLLFAITALAVAAMAGFELALIHAQTASSYAFLVRWIHVPIAVLIVSQVLFVWNCLGAGRRWLGWAIIGTRAVVLLIDFLQSPNFNFVEMRDPFRIAFLGETVSVPNGTVSAWTRFGELSSLLLLLFLLDATAQLLRRGDRRRAGIGAALLAFVLGSAGVTSLTHAGVVTWPYVLSFGFLGVVVVMTYDLATDVVRAGQLSRELATSETALKEREDLLALASVVPDLAFWSWDVAKDQVWMTANGRALCGLGPEERLDFERVMSCLHPEDRDGFERAIFASLETQGGFQWEYRVLGSEGKAHWVSGVGRAESNGDGTTHVRGVSIDVTAQKLAEIETRQQRAEIAHLSRMTSVGELSGSIAHEINQPLAAILSNAQAAQRFLASNGGHPEEVREILEDIVREDKHAGEVIRRLRQFVRKGEESIEVLDPQGVIVDALRLLRTDLLDRGVHLDTDISPRLPRVRADRVQIQQVLINLVTNACDAMAEVEPSRRRLVLRAEPSADGVRVTVSDCGNGLPEGQTDRIFDPFVTTKSHGMGLGLAVCRTIVGAHGGRLWASNNPEGGATFEFTIPSVEASA